MIFIQRKGKPEDKYRVLTVFQYMDIFSNSISTSCGDPEQDFIFHKKLGEVMIFFIKSFLFFFIQALKQ